MTLKLGTAGGKAFTLPVDAATQTFAFIARKGAGKTYAAGKMTEQLMDAGVQCVILDTVGNWYGLRLAADGKGQGFDIPVLGGLRGDLPLDPAGGELVADLVVDTGRSIIVDLSQFSQADRKRFATAFGVRLWQRKKAEPDPAPVHLVIEESQLIIPQMVRGDEARMVGIYEEIIRLGRNYGIGVSMISQRPQSVNKEVLTQTECLVVLQVNGAPERKALKEWIVHQGMDVKLLDELPSLPVGTAYVWSPQWLGILQKVHIGAKRTLDASATPKVGQRRQQRELAPLDLEAFKARMAATIEKAKADDPKVLRRRIQELERQLSVKRMTPDIQPTVKVERVEVPMLKDAQIDRLEAVVEKLATYAGETTEISKQLSEAASGLSQAIRAARQPVSMPSVWTPLNNVAARAQSTPTKLHKIMRNSHDSCDLPAGERRLLTAIAQHPNGCTREQLTVLTGYKRSSRDTYLQRMRQKMLVVECGEFIEATAEGVMALGPDYEPLPTGDALRDHWMDRLPEGERKILAHLVDAYPQAVERDLLSERTGYQRSSRDTYLQRLSSRRLVVPEGRGLVKASEILFS